MKSYFILLIFVCGLSCKTLNTKVQGKESHLKSPAASTAPGLLNSHPICREMLAKFDQLSLKEEQLVGALNAQQLDQAQIIRSEISTLKVELYGDDNSFFSKGLTGSCTNAMNQSVMIYNPMSIANIPGIAGAGFLSRMVGYIRSPITSTRAYQYIMGRLANFRTGTAVLGALDEIGKVANASTPLADDAIRLTDEGMILIEAAGEGAANLSDESLNAARYTVEQIDEILNFYQHGDDFIAAYASDDTYAVVDAAADLITDVGQTAYQKMPNCISQANCFLLRIYGAPPVNAPNISAGFANISDDVPSLINQQLSGAGIHNVKLDPLKEAILFLDDTSEIAAQVDGLIGVANEFLPAGAGVSGKPATGILTIVGTEIRDNLPQRVGHAVAAFKHKGIWYVVDGRGGRLALLDDALTNAGHVFHNDQVFPLREYLVNHGFIVDKFDEAHFFVTQYADDAVNAAGVSGGGAVPIVAPPPANPGKQGKGSKFDD